MVAARRIAWIGAVAWLSWLGACGGDDPGAGVEHGAQSWAGPLGHTIHLDPRLEDGSPSAEVLAGATTVVRRFDFGSERSVGGPDWRVLNGKAVFRPHHGATAFAGDPAPSGGVKTIALKLGEALDAASLDAVEIDLAYASAGLGGVIWGRPNDSGPRQSSYVRVEHPEIEGEVTTVRIPLAFHGDWFGEVRDFRVVPNFEGKQSFLIHEIRFIAGSFVPGSDALGEEFPDRPFADAGLVAMGRDARRTWPSDFDVPLYHEDIEVPEGAWFEADVAVPRNLVSTLRGPKLRVDLRVVGEPQWRAVGSRPIRFNSAASSGWERIRFDLGPWAGQRVDLRMACMSPGSNPEEDEGNLERARILWGAPRIVGRDPEGRERPNLILITLDTLRRDAVMGLGEFEAGARIPNIQALGKESWVFTNTWTSCNLTNPSHASILTGLALQDHGVLDNLSMLSPANTTLAEVLRAEGYETAAAVTVDHLQTGDSGLGQGFDRFLQATDRSLINGSSTVDRVCGWLEDWHEGGDRPLFLWVHLFDPHAPYVPPEEFVDEYARRAGRGRPPKRVGQATLTKNSHGRPGMFLEGVNNGEYARWLYDAGVSYTDHLVGRLWNRVEENGWTGSSALVLSSDHGESFGEQGQWCTHATMHTSTMAVPMLLRPPGGTTPARIDELTWNLDIAPTLLGWARVPAPRGLRGLDLRGFVTRSDRTDRRIWIEHDRLLQVGFVEDGTWFSKNLAEYKILGPEVSTPEGHSFLFDLAEDPRLERNLARGFPQRVEALDSALEEFREGALEREAVSRSLSAEDLRQLRELGYLEGEH